MKKASCGFCGKPRIAANVLSCAYCGRPYAETAAMTQKAPIESVESASVVLATTQQTAQSTGEARPASTLPVPSFPSAPIYSGWGMPPYPGAPIGLQPSPQPFPLTSPHPPLLLSRKRMIGATAGVIIVYFVLRLLIRVELGFYTRAYTSHDHALIFPLYDLRLFLDGLAFALPVAFLLLLLCLAKRSPLVATVYVAGALMLFTVVHLLLEVTTFLLLIPDSNPVALFATLFNPHYLTHYLLWRIVLSSFCAPLVALGFARLFARWRDLRERIANTRILGTLILALCGALAVYEIYDAFGYWLLRPIYAPYQYGSPLTSATLARYHVIEAVALPAIFITVQICVVLVASVMSARTLRRASNA